MPGLIPENYTSTDVFLIALEFIFVCCIKFYKEAILVTESYMNEFGLVWWSMWYIFYLEIINTEEEIEDFLWENLIILSNSRKLIFCSIVVE